jgi:hypothetical protein
LQLRLSTDRAQRWAGGVQFVGTVLFNISTFDALQAIAERRPGRPPDLDAGRARVDRVPGGQRVGVRRGAAAVAGVAARATSAGRSRTLNMVGSIAFGISAAASYVLSDDTLRDAQRANAGTFVGAICFLVGAALLIPDQVGAAADSRWAGPSAAERQAEEPCSSAGAVSAYDVCGAPRPARASARRRCSAAGRRRRPSPRPDAEQLELWRRSPAPACACRPRRR